MNRKGNRLLALVGIGISAMQGLSLNADAVDKAAPPATFGKLPIKELTVFKDGHACVAHEGEMPTDDQGNVQMDYLPAPLIGAFWPYSADKRARLAGVVAGQKRVLVEHTALNLRDLLDANIGAEALITESGSQRYQATIVAVPTRSGEEQAATSPPNTPERLPEKGNLVLLKTPEGVKAISLDRIQEVVFMGPHKSAVQNEEFRSLLTLKLDWGKASPGRSAKVGLFYLQKGVRWIPEYKVEIDGQGNALVKLNATLINELADLDDVSVNLVVGVPTFAFKDTIDPIALQQNLAQLSQYFQAGGSAYNSPIASQFSNAIMSQNFRADDYRGASGPGQGGALGADVGEAEKSEDLFVFKVPHVTLRRGERMVLPVAEFTLAYKDVFTLELPFGPPREVCGNLNYEQQRELARIFNAPKFMHKLRLTNSSRFPLTTAPALIVRDGRVLAQGLMTYTSTGANVDLPITAAVDFQVKKTETETKRTPDAFRLNGSSFVRVDLKGKICITSHHAKAAELEISRYVLGAADSADHNGKVDMLNVLDDGEYMVGADHPNWWNWYGWPSWWNRLNGTGRINWKLTLDPNQAVELSYDWHYFWQ